MATNGQRQLLRLTISYCTYGGSSRFVREFFKTPQLVAFANANTDLEIATVVKKGQHPFVRGEYRTGWDKTIGVKNMENEELLKKITMLNQSSGRKITKVTKNVYSDKPSVQGFWTPALDMRHEAFEIKEVR
jgi:large subunit ribosomal protein L43